MSRPPAWSGLGRRLPAAAEAASGRLAEGGRPRHNGVMSRTSETRPPAEDSGGKSAGQGPRGGPPAPSAAPSDVPPPPADARPPAPRRVPLIDRAEQVLLAVLALAVVAGVLWQAADYWRLGREPLAVVPPPDGPTYRVNVNQADWVTLALVPGLGRALAERIVALRAERGGRFASLDELKEVKGISDKVLEKVRPYLYLADPSPGAEPVEMKDGN